ncbi:hypothetical protein ACST8B_28760, partial [Klebsiella pneumoniae]
MFAGKKSAQIREILINESAWEEMTCLFALSLTFVFLFCAAYKKKKKNNKQIIKSSTLNPALNPPPRE